MEGTSDTCTSSEGGRANLLIHGRYLRYIYFVRRWQTNLLIHGRYLRYIYFVRRWQSKLVDTWKVPQIHLLRQKVADQPVDAWKVPQIHGRYLRYMYFVRKVLNYPTTAIARDLTTTPTVFAHNQYISTVAVNHNSDRSR